MRCARLTIFSLLGLVTTLALSGCSGTPISSNPAAPTGTSPNTSPLIVNSVSPANNATCVSATTAITITFDRAPDGGTVNSDNIVVMGAGGAVIPVTLSVNGTQVVLTPKSALPSGTITVTVKNIGDLADVMMAAPYTWSFSTACISGGGGGTGAEYFYFSAGSSAGTPEFYAYAIDSATGNLTPVPGMPFQASVGATPQPCGQGCSLTPLADPLGRFLFYNFTQRPNQHGIGSMKVDPTTGALTNDDVLDDGYNGTSNPSIENISADPQGRFIYGAGTLNTPPYGTDWISSIVVSSVGKLSFAPGEPFEYPEGNNGGDVPAPAAIGKFLFAADPNLISLGANQPSKMFTFELNQTTGAMGAVNNILDGLDAGEQVITPSGKFLYSERHSIMSNGFQGPSELAGFQVNADGSLTPIAQPPTQTPAQPAIITMSPNGNFLYVSGVTYSGPSGGPFTSANDVRAYAIDQNTVSLSLTAEYSNNAQGIVPTIDPAVKYVYISAATPSNPGASGLAVYRVDPTTGALTPVPGPVIVLPINLGGGAIVRPQ